MITNFIENEILIDINVYIIVELILNVFFLPLGDFTVVELSTSNLSAVFISPSVYSRLNNYLTKFCLLIKPKITNPLYRERKFDIIP